MKQIQSGYKILLLGKNGEPIKGILLKISIFKSWFTKYIEEELITNNEGEVIIIDKEFEDISSIRAGILSTGNEDIFIKDKEWPINTFENKTLNQKTFDFYEDQEFSLPFYKDFYEEDEIQFLKYYFLDSSVRLI